MVLEFTLTHLTLALWGAICIVAVRPSNAAAKSCVVRGVEVSLDDVTVYPRGSQPFRLSVDDAGVKAHIPSRGVATPLSVQATLSFSAQAKEGMMYWIGKPTTAERGIVRLLPGARMVNVRWTGRAVVGSAIMYSGSQRTWSDDGAIDIPPEETIESVHVPCTSLPLGPLGKVYEKYLEAESCQVDGDNTWWHPFRSPDPVKIREQPQTDAHAVILQSKCHGSPSCLQVERVSEEGAWMRVRHHGEHVCVVGWIPRSELQRIPDGTGGEARSYLPVDRRAEYAPLAYVGEAPGTYYEGPASVQIGTAVTDCSVENGQWATVRRVGVFRVHFVKGQRWADLLEIPGVYGSQPLGCVPVSSLLPPHDVK